MTRRSTHLSLLSRVTLPMLALGLAACSFSFSSGPNGSGTPTTAGKPAQPVPGTAQPTGTTTKPLSPTASTNPNPTTAGPTRRPPAAVEVPASVEPQLTAVCRITDEALATMCHMALDPIAADDFVAWEEHLTDDTMLTRPSRVEGMQRFKGVEHIRRVASDSGGLKGLLHLRPTDRIVGTTHTDCRKCRRPSVAFEANSRTGTIIVTLDTTRTPKVSTIEVTSQVQRKPLDPVRIDGVATPKTPTKPAPGATIRPPADDAPKGVATSPAAKK